MEVAQTNLTLSAGGEILFTKGTTITDVAVLTIGGTIRANNGTNNVALTARADTLEFNGVTTITASNLTLTSTNAQSTATAGNLTINISGGLTLGGNFNIGTGVLDVDGVDFDIFSATSFEAATIDLTLTAAGNAHTNAAIHKTNGFSSFGLTLTATTINISATYINIGRGRDGVDLPLPLQMLIFLRGLQ